MNEKVKLVEKLLVRRAKEILHSHANADVVIYSESGETKSLAHRCILIASPLMRSILETFEQKIQPKSVVHLPQFSQESVQLFLKFLYTGQIEFQESSHVGTEFQELTTLFQINPSVDMFNKSYKDKQRCNLCDKSLDSKAALNSHLKSVHPELSTEEKSNKETVDQIGPKNDDKIIEKDQPDLSKDQLGPNEERHDFGKDQPDPRRDRPDLGKDQPDPRKDQSDFSKDQPDHSKDQPDQSKDQPDLNKDEPDPNNDQPDLNRNQSSKEVFAISTPEKNEMENEPRTSIGSLIQGERRGSYTPIVPDYFASNHFDDGCSSVPEMNACDESENQICDEGLQLVISEIEDEIDKDEETGNRGKDSEFKMPDSFDIPEEIIQNEAARIAQQREYANTSGKEGESDRDNLQLDMEKLMQTSSESSISESSEETIENITKAIKSTKVIRKAKEKAKEVEKKVDDKKDKSLDKSKICKVLFKDLFGAEDDTEVSTPEKKKPKPVAEADKASDLISSILKSSSMERVSNPKPSSSSVLNELEEKRRRTLKALKVKGTVEKKADDYKKIDRNKWASSSKDRKRKRHRQSHDHCHESGGACTSSCKGNHLMAEDKEWVVDDLSEDEEEWEPSASDEDSGEWTKKKKRRAEESYDAKESSKRSMVKSIRERRKKTIEEERSYSSDENGPEDITEADGSQRSRSERYSEKLSRFKSSTKRKKIINVSVQNVPEENIVELSLYRLRLSGESSTVKSSGPSGPSLQRSLSRIVKSFQSSSDEDEPRRDKETKDESKSEKAKSSTEAPAKKPTLKRSISGVLKEKEKDPKLAQKLIVRLKPVDDSDKDKGKGKYDKIHQEKKKSSIQTNRLTDWFSSYKHHYGATTEKKKSIDSGKEPSKDFLKMSFKKKTSNPDSDQKEEHKS